MDGFFQTMQLPSVGYQFWVDPKSEDNDWSSVMVWDDSMTRFRKLQPHEMIEFNRADKSKFEGV